MRSKIVALAVAGAALAAAPAQAGFMAEMNAANALERKLDNKWPSWVMTAVCDQHGKRKFFCDFMGSRGDCYKTGEARVTKGSRYYITLRGHNTDCF